MAEKVLLGDALRTIVLKGSQETAADYERQLREADDERKKTQAEFKEKSAGKIKELKQQIKELSTEIKNAPSERKKEIGEQIKILNGKIEQYKTPPVNRFAYLDSSIKAYAGAQLLFKPMLGEEVLKSNNIEFGVNEQGRIEVDAEQLSNSVLGDKIREAADYIFGRTRELNEKITQASDINNIIRSDAKNLLGLDNVEKIDFDLIERCHKAYEAEKAERERRKKQIEQRKQESLTGIKVIKEYPDGYSIVEMLPSPVYDENGKLQYHTSLKFESDEMGHCVGRGGYNQHIGKEGWHFYSLRGADENGVMVPHCTISIENGKLAQIKGNSNGAVKNRYIPDVRDFVKSLDMPIPESEKSRIGYVNDSNNKEVDLFALKENTRLDELSLSAGDYKGINLANISYVKTLNFEGGVTRKDFEEIAKIGLIENLTLSNENEAQCYTQTLPNVERLVVKGNFDLPNIGKARYIKYTGIKEYDFNHDYRRLKQLELEEDVPLNIEKAPILEEGIRGGIWGDASKLSTKELLSKMFGSKWVEKYVFEQEGRLIVNTDLDFKRRGLSHFPYDFGDIKINGTLNLRENQLMDIPNPIKYPECRKMIINNSYQNENINRFDELPYLPEGIDCESDFDLELYKVSFKDILKKINIGDRSKFTEKGEKIYYQGDLNLSNVNVLNQRYYFDLDMSELNVDGSVKVLHNAKYLPNAKKIEIFKIDGNITLPDVTEQVVVYCERPCNIQGKNLKTVTYSDYVRLSVKEAGKMNMQPEYYGNFIFIPTGDTEKKQNLSALKISGTIGIFIDTVFDEISCLPQCKKLRVDCPLTETMLSKINSKTETICCQNLFDVDMLPPNSQLKYVDLNYLRAGDEKSIDKFIRKLSERGIMIKYLDNNVDYSQDLSDILVKNFEMQWDRDIKNISKFPKAEKLHILSPDDHFEKDFLKDATPYLKELELGYMNEKTDFLALPPDVKLERVHIYDSAVSSNILNELPQSIKNIEFLRCRNSIDFEPLNRLPNLEKLEINQMNVPANAFDKVDPERLKQINISGDTRTVMRVQEIIAIHQLPPTEENNKIKKLHQWLTDDKNNIDYKTKQIVFYLTAADVMKGKHPQPITTEELSARVKGIEKFKLDSCAKIIMANELNHKTGNNKIGRTVLDDYKGKKAGYYTHMLRYYDQDKDFGKVGEIMKAAVTRNIKHHPDFWRAENIVEDRMDAHQRSLQSDFNRLLNDRVESLTKYHEQSKNKTNTYSFNQAVQKMCKCKS